MGKGRKGTGISVIDDFLNISTVDLRKWKYFQADKTGSIKYSQWGLRSMNFNVSVKSELQEERIRLAYEHNGKQFDYYVRLFLRRSNLGKGFVYYFICPRTRKTCRTLHLINGEFVHRSALQNSIYFTQQLSGIDKLLVRRFEQSKKARNALRELDRKYFKKYYNGKQTKRYKRLIELVKAGEGIDETALIMGNLC